MSHEKDAGRELDAEVAEKVFGYVWRKSRSTGRRCIYAPGVVPEHMVQLADGTEPLVEDWQRHMWMPRYSTEIAAAWTVVEAPVAKGFKVNVMNRASGWACHVVANPGQQTERVVYEHHDTAPLAICLAALEVTP